MHPFDRALARRALGHSTVISLLAVAVVVATDEPYSTSAMRVARLCAFAPGLAAIGCLATLAQARARGELLALSALGASPWRVGLGVSLGGWALGALASALVVSPLADPTALFPGVAASDAWLFQGGSLLDPLSGVAVAPSGEITLGAANASIAAVTGPGNAAAGLAVVPLALVAPAWATAPLRAGTRFVSAALTLAAAVFLLHAVAAGRLGGGWLCLVALPLALPALLGHLRGAGSS